MIRPIAFLFIGALALQGQENSLSDKRYPLGFLSTAFSSSESTLSADGKSVYTAHYTATDWTFQQWNLETGAQEKYWRLNAKKDTRVKLAPGGKNVLCVTTKTRKEDKTDEFGAKFEVIHSFFVITPTDFRSDKAGKSIELEQGIENKYGGGSAEDRDAVMLTTDFVFAKGKAVPSQMAKVFLGACSADHQFILSRGNHSEKPGVFDMKAGSLLLPVEAPPADTGLPVSGAFAGNSRSVAVVTNLGQVTVLDLPKGGTPVKLNGPPFRIFALALNKDGTRLGAIYDDKVFRLWDTKKGVEIGSTPLWGDPGSWVRFTPDDKLAVCAGRESFTSLDAATGEAKRLVSPVIGGRLFTARDANVAVAVDANRITCWTLEPPTPLWWKDLPSDPQGVWITPNGKRILTADSSNAARLIDAANGKDLVTHNCGAESVIGLAADASGFFTNFENKVRRYAFNDAGGAAVAWDSQALGVGRFGMPPTLGCVVHTGDKVTFIDPADGTFSGQAAAPGLDPTRMDLSPDGTKAAFLIPTRKEIVIVTRVGAEVGKPIALKADLGRTEGNQVAWAPDGKSLFVAGLAEIHVLNAAAGTFDAPVKVTRANATMISNVYPGWLVIDINGMKLYSRVK